MTSEVVRWCCNRPCADCNHHDDNNTKEIGTSDTLSSSSLIGYKKCMRSSSRHRSFSNWFAGDDVFKSIFYKLVFLWLVINVNLVLVVLGDERMDKPSVSGHYTSTWAVHIPDGPEVADQIAAEHGFINLGKVSYNFFFLFY